uniref:Ubiquitin-like domain-containing protein n=1 Tax=Leersia perrieri TaxID=77586 RepID=A0A0D9VLL5_9ORYZ
MDVTFRQYTGSSYPGSFRGSFTLEISFYATVLEMKQEVMRRKNIPVSSQRIFFRGVELSDGNTLMQLGIGQDTVHLLMRRDPPDGCCSGGSVGSSNQKYDSSSSSTS